MISFKKRLIFSIGFLSLMLSGCQSLPDPLGLFAKKASDVFMMKNLVNEECTYRESFADEYKQFGTQQYEVYCGRWEHPSGHIFKVPVRQAELNSLKQWTDSGAWRNWLNKQMVCEPSKTVIVLKNKSALLQPCKLLNGNWPYLALITQVGNDIYLADGIPTIEPVLEQSIAQLSGLQSQPDEMSADTRKIAIKRIRQLIKGPVYGSRELMEYFRLMSAGQFYNSIKDYTTSALRYRKALDLHEQILGESNLGAIDPLMHLALELSNQGNLIEAEALFERARILAYQSPDRSDLARYLSYRGLHAANSRNFQEALDFAQQATEIRKKLASQFQQTGDKQINFDNLARVDFAVFASIDTPTVVDIVQSLYVEASMLERLGEKEQAEQVLREAKSILQRTREVPPSWEPEIEGLIARIAKAKGAENERGKHLKVATDLWEDFAPGERPSAINFMKLGDALKAQDRSEDAMQAFRQGVALVKARNGSFSYDQLLPYFSTALELAEQNPDQKSELHAEIFTAGQLIRSELTTQNIAMAVARLAANDDKAGRVIRDFQDSQDERFLLHSAYDAEFSKLAGDEQAETLKKIKAKLSEVDARLSQLSVQVQTAFPRYNQLVDSAIDADRVMSLLKPDEALVQILLGVDDGMMIVVSDEQVTAVPIDISFNEAGDIVNELRKGLEPTASGQLEKFDIKFAHLVFQRLFSGVANEISDKNLITVLSGPFLSLPLGVLVTELPSDDSSFKYSHVDWLAKTSAISLLPSVRSFVGLRDDIRDSKATKSFLGFGDFVPVNPASVDQLEAHRSGDCKGQVEQLPNYTKTRANFIPLPATKLEISEVSSLFPESTVDLSMGLDFTDKLVKNLPLSEYQVLYFATHGLLPNDLECQPQPSLVTSPPSTLQGKDDGFLDMEEILKLRLDADIVVLSACNTGGPDKKGGENLSGLARAFFFSGARSLLVSHWPAADEATAKLMIEVFNLLREESKMGLAGALQKVQKAFIEASNPDHNSYMHPFYWANFTAVGEGKKGLQPILQTATDFSETGFLE